jgi:hypothetical protein
MATEKNKEAKGKLLEMSNNGFNFSYTMIAKYLADHKITKAGIPYSRNDIANSLSNDSFTDLNIINAVDNVFLGVKKKLTRIQKYHQGVGAPRKKK